MQTSGAIISIIGTLLGVVIGYFFSLRAVKLQWHRIAGAKLRAAFAPEIAKYDLNINRGDKWNINMMENLFKEALPGHAAAIEEYRYFIPSKSRVAYQQAWENYKNDFLEYYENQSIFKQRIDAIFKFAKI